MNEDRLYRSRDDRMIAGVAGGMAERWGSDPSMLRLLWVLAAIFTGGIALIVYIVLAVVVPEDPVGYGRPPVDAFAAGSPSGGPDPAAELGAQRAGELADARAARRAAQRARRGDGGKSVALVFGALFIIAGVWLLLDEYVPAFDTDWLWPVALLGLGVVILAMALRPGERGTPDHPADDGASGTAGGGA
ncbi:MAG TPA: PspC domain-containing protein [Candidatus Limnocylindrales bacterium]|nr:PspC domain-containing protein [Candidatus Limnocylindrales bacterium]